MSKNATKLRKEIVQHIISLSIYVIICILLYKNHIIITIFSVLSFIQIFNIFIKIFDYILAKKLERAKNQSQAFYDNFRKYFKQIYEQAYKRTYQHQYQFTYSKKQSEITNSYKLFKLEPSCTVEDIKKTYRKLASIWHPDKFINETQENQEISKRNIQKLNAAYEVFKKNRNFN
jgi:DnaJ like chaperone protein